MTKQHGTQDVKVTNNTRAIRWSDGDKKKIIFTNYIFNQLHDWEKSLCQCRVVSCKACSFTVFCQKKCLKKKKDKKRVTPGWTDISSPCPVKFLSRSSMYYIILTLHNTIKLLNVVSINSFSWASNCTSLTTWCTNKLRRLELAQ